MKRLTLAIGHALTWCGLVGCSGDGADGFTHTGATGPASDNAAAALLSSTEGRTAEIDLASPLIDRLTVRMRGSGWPSNTRLRIQQCYTFGPTLAPLCDPYTRPPSFVTTDANGAFKIYAPLRTDYGTLALPSGPFVHLRCSSGNCDLRIGEDQAFDATAVIIPLTFVDTPSIDVVSNYEPEWQSLLDDGLRISGLPAGELQRTGAAVTMWVLRAAGVSGSPIARTGSISYTTSYTQDEYRDSSVLASEFDYTLDEAQKVGALFWSWLLAGQPPP